MARKASRRTAATAPAGFPSPSSHRETGSEGVSERPFSLLKSSDLKSTGNDEVRKAAVNNNTLPNAAETNDEEEFNDYIECLGYPPPRKEKRVDRLNHEHEEFNDYIECLGYPPPRT